MTGRVRKRKVKEGVIVSDKMNKTVIVKVTRRAKHPVYGKIVSRAKNFMTHNENIAKLGDKVKIMETRPLSKNKRWRVVEVVKKL
ncbi:30S ribosomal protein S17 [bacterium Unc6]|nr:30S ribosomal protein S17 [bacterium Unc6]